MRKVFLVLAGVALLAGCHCAPQPVAAPAKHFEPSDSAQNCEYARTLCFDASDAERTYMLRI